jgi:hypothetical protein
VFRDQIRVLLRIFGVGGGGGELKEIFKLSLVPSRKPGPDESELAHSTCSAQSNQSFLHVLPGPAVAACYPAAKSEGLKLSKIGPCVRFTKRTDLRNSRAEI